MSTRDLIELRKLLDKYINKPTDNPVTEHRDAGHVQSLMIHMDGFLAWHQHFVAKLEHWLVINGAEKFVPLPYWNPAESILAQLNNIELYHTIIRYMTV
jgi:Common central domain of tyrosinase